jgi:hypothetical protein
MKLPATPRRRAITYTACAALVATVAIPLAVHYHQAWQVAHPSPVPLTAGWSDPAAAMDGVTGIRLTERITIGSTEIVGETTADLTGGCRWTHTENYPSAEEDGGAAGPVSTSTTVGDATRPGVVQLTQNRGAPAFTMPGLADATTEFTALAGVRALDPCTLHVDIGRSLVRTPDGSATPNDELARAARDYDVLESIDASMPEFYGRSASLTERVDLGRALTSRTASFREKHAPITYAFDDRGRLTSVNASFRDSGGDMRVTIEYLTGTPRAVDTSALLAVTPQELQDTQAVSDRQARDARDKLHTTLEEKFKQTTGNEINLRWLF